MDGSQFAEGRVCLRLPLNILGRDCFQGGVGDGITRLVDHVSPAVFADLDGGDNIIEEGLRRDKIDNPCNSPVLAAAGVDRRSHHDGQLSRHLADQGLGHIDIALHRLLDVFPAGVVVAVKNADAVGADDVAPLEAVHPDALIHYGAFFLHRHSGVGQLRNVARVHGYILVGRQLLADARRRQNSGFA